jgi:hypothetical protein
MKPYLWCPHKACDVYKSPEQLCDVCEAVRLEVRTAVEMNLGEARKNILITLQGQMDRVMKSGL